jgi:uncharacterized lipoprotein NlpE involved in copper resistance
MKTTTIVMMGICLVLVGCGERAGDEAAEVRMEMVEAAVRERDEMEERIREMERERMEMVAEKETLERRVQLAEDARDGYRKLLLESNGVKLRQALGTLDE